MKKKFKKKFCQSIKINRVNFEHQFNEYYFGVLSRDK